MKIQSWVKSLSIFILLILLVSCSTTTFTKEDQLTATTIRLADELVKEQDYQQACYVYERSIKVSNDYRLYYNLAIIKSHIGEDWSVLLKQAVEKNPDKKEDFLKLSADLAESEQNTALLADCLDQLCTLHPDDTTLRKRFCHALIANNQNSRALEEAMKLWDAKVFDQETAEILYTINPDEWKVVYEALSVKEEQSQKQPQE